LREKIILSKKRGEITHFDGAFKAFFIFVFQVEGKEEDII